MDQSNYLFDPSSRCSFALLEDLPITISASSPEMEHSVRAVERIACYSFRNKKLLEEALTHSSCPDSPSYQRLEFVGDAVLAIAVSNYIFLAYPELDPGQLTVLRAANISTEKLARVAVRHGLYQYVKRNAAALDDRVREFTNAICEEGDAVAHGGSMKAPKVLADIIESLAAAIYMDLNFDLHRMWLIFKHLLEPFVTPKDLQQQPQPVSRLLELCQKHGKQVDIRYWKSDNKSTASIYVDDKFIISASSDQKDIAKLNACKAALEMLSEYVWLDYENSGTLNQIDASFEIDRAKHVLNEICSKRKWPKPNYSIENDRGPSHEKKFVSSVQIAFTESTLCMIGDEKSRVKDADNSAASLMIRALQEGNYL